MTETARLYERLTVVLNYLDDHSDKWPLWKVNLIMSKIECLMRICETTDRRDAEKS